MEPLSRQPASIPVPAKRGTVPLLSIEGLSLTRGDRLILDDVALTLDSGETLGLVGESGAGKSTVALTLMGLLRPPTVGLAGQATFDGKVELVAAPESEWAKLRGRRIAMVFQDAASALNPCFTVGSQLTSPLRRLLRMSRRAARRRAIELLESVGLNDAEARLSAYPHQLSGGMQQRVMIAIALSCDPELLLADEPTSALDVTIQAQIIRLILEQCRMRGASCIFVLHDLALASQACDSIMVLYAGQVMESGPGHVVLRDPMHPYTKSLRSCVLELDTDILVPPPAGLAPESAAQEGCRFAPRCPRAIDRCTKAKPPLQPVRGRALACWNPE